METPDQIPFNELFRTGGAREAVAEIRQALNFADLNAVDALYDEAISLAREGHLGKARDRLRMLLTLNPADGGAHLVLAKVFAAQRKWTEAIAELDAAAACGQRLPPGLKEALVESRDLAAQPRAPRVVRTDGEVKALREEARRLRTDQQRYERVNRELESKAQVWTIATGVVTGVAALALLMVGLSWPGQGDYGVEQLASAEAEASAELDEPIAEADLEEETLAAAPPAVERAERAISSRPAPPVSEPTQARIEREPVTAYTVRSGDTLWKIAGRVYDDKTRWKEIRDANQDVLKGSDALRVGMVLTIPQDQS